MPIRSYFLQSAECGFRVYPAVHGYNQSTVIPFLALFPVILFLYFDLPTQHWFLVMTQGYPVRTWIPPLALFAMMLGIKLWKRELPVPATPHSLFIAFYGLASLVTLSLNETPHGTIKYWLVMTAPSWMYFVVLDSCAGETRIRFVLNGLFFCSLLLILYTLYVQHVAAADPSAIPPEIMTRSGYSIPIAGEAFYKEKGIDYSRGFLLYSCGHYAGMLLFPFLFGIFQFFRTVSWRRWLFLGLSLFMASQIINTLSRTDIVAMSVGLMTLWGALAYEGVTPKGQRRFIFSSVFVSLILYTAFFKPILLGRFLQLLTFLDSEIINQYIISSQIAPPHHVAAEDPHIVSAVSSLQAFIERPFTGWGFSFAEQELHELNRYLFILISTGILTFIAYVSFWAGIMISLGRQLAKKTRAALSPSCGAYFIACIAMLVFKFAYVGIETFYYWIIGALAMAWLYDSRKSSAAPHGSTC